MIISAYQFTETSVCFDELKNSRHYKLMTTIESNKDSENYGLTKQDKDWIVENIRSNTFFRNGSIPLMGWAFDFRPICQEYWIKYTYENDYMEYLVAILAPDKESAIKYVKQHFIDCEILEIREP